VPYSRASANRVFGYALLASLAVHAFVLGAEWPRFADTLRYPVEVLTPLVARLVEPPRAPVEEKRAEEKPKAKRESAPRAKPLPVPAPRFEPEQPVAAAPAVAPPPAPAPLPAPAPSAAPPQAFSPPPAQKPAPVDATPSLVAQYRAALLAEAARHKRYPPQAIDNGWEGEVVVRMAIGADGSLAALDVRSSSGHAALDRQALEMFRKARAEVPVPEALRGKRFTMELRAVFNLKDQASG